MGQEDDIGYWQTYRDGERDALGMLAQRYYKSLLRYGLKFGMDRQVVEDGIQEIFLNLWQNRSHIGTPPSVKNYLFKSLRNHIIAYHRYQQRFTDDEETGWALDFPEVNNIETTLIEIETLTERAILLQEQLSNLPKREREALYLRYYENLNVAEISEIMGVNKQSVSNFLQKALLRLRTKWPLHLVLSLIFS